MILNTLTAISPVDGRYRSKVEKLDDFFSEFALIRYREELKLHISQPSVNCICRN